MIPWRPAVALLVALSLTGCLYSNISVPLDTDLDRTELGSKVGRSRAHNVMFLFAWGDAGTQAAAEDGQIKVLTHADRELYLILFGLYGRQTTVVYGE
jgi:hypothetical protein